MNKKSGWIISVSTFLALSMLTGCSTVGPKLYEASFNDYTDAISKTADGQMLGNLVRMRYYESPVFLQVHNVTTSFSVGANAGASATLNEGSGNNYGLSAGANSFVSVMKSYIGWKAIPQMAST